MSIMQPPANGNHIAPTKQQPKTIDQWLKDPGLLEQFANALPKHMTPERFARVALTALNRVPKLRECTQASLMRCLMDCSAMGLEPDGRRAHLIPYGTECTLILDYKGIVELARRSGDVASIHADIVCENDEFEYDMGDVKRHKIDFRSPRGKVYAAYAVATLKDGSRQAAVMTRDEIESIRGRSRAGQKGPWVSDWNEMAKKTAFRRLSKWLVLSPEIRDAIDIDDAHSGIIETTAIPARVEASGGNNRLAAMLSEDLPQDDGGPTTEDLAGTVDHSADTGNKVDRLQLSLETINRAVSPESIESILADEQASGDHGKEAFAKLVEAGDTRKRQIAIEKQSKK